MLVSRAGTPTHRVLVKMFDCEQFAPGEAVVYHGKPNWKFEPLDPKGRDEWAKSVADPERVDHENRMTHARPVMRPDAKPVVLD